MNDGPDLMKPMAVALDTPNQGHHPGSAATSGRGAATVSRQYRGAGERGGLLNPAQTGHDSPIPSGLRIHGGSPADSPIHPLTYEHRRQERAQTGGKSA